MSRQWRPGRGALIAAAVVAVLSLLTSPILAVWSVVVGGAVTLLSLVLVRWVPRARTGAILGLGLVVGALPYLGLAVVAGLLGDASRRRAGDRRPTVGPVRHPWPMRQAALSGPTPDANPTRAATGHAC